MAKPVPASPALPVSLSPKPNSLQKFDNDLKRSLMSYLQELARRANGSLPKDGTESATSLSVIGAGVFGGTVTTPRVIVNGVTFPAVAVPSADPNTLDDYEEGGWTPTISGTTVAGAGTYSLQAGSYVKIGKTVYVTARITWTAHTGTGNVQISNLPFTTNTIISALTVWKNNLTYTASRTLVGVTVGGTTNITLWQMDGAGGTAQVPMDTAADIIITGTYLV